MAERPIQTATDRKRNRAVRVAIAAIACIPLIYGGALIWANQDPTHRLDKVPAAVVDLDQPVTHDGATIDVGKSVAHELVTDHDSSDFDWTETDAATARAGLKDGTYLATITLPKTLSANAVSLGGDVPSDAAASNVTITTDDGHNYIVGVAAKTIGLTISQKAAKSVAQDYLGEIYSGFDQISGQLGDAASGAKKLASGAGSLQSGASQLDTGAQKSAAGAAQLASGIGTLSSGAQTLAGGTAQVSAGAQSLASGTAQLSTGAQSLATGTAQVSTGAQSLADGSARLSTGAQSLASGSSQLAAGTDQLSSGLDQLKATTDPLAQQSAAISDAATALSSGLTTYSTQVDQAIATCKDLVASGASTDPQLTQLCTQVSKLGSAQQLADEASQLGTDAPKLATAIDTAASGADTLSAKAHEAATGAQSLAAGAQQTATGAKQLASGAQQTAAGAKSVASGAQQTATGAQNLASGAQQTASGASRLASAAQQASTGASALATGTQQVADGARQLDSGAGSLASGSSTLADKLAQGQASVPSYDSAEKKHLSSIASQPIGLTQTKLDSVPSYGYGLAPYFLALGAWVGGLSIYMILRAIPHRAIEAGRPGWLAALLGYLRGAWISLVQAALLYLVVTLGIGVHPQHPVGLALFMGLTSLAFTAVNHTLMVLFGSRGRFLGLILLVLQVAAAGATYPIQTAPGFFQVLHGLLPLTYVANAIRSLIAGGSAGVGTGIVVMVCWMFAALAVSVGASMFRHRRKSELLLPDFAI